MTPKQYLDEIVAPCFKEYIDDPSSRRRAYLACVTMFHLTDFLNRHGEIDPVKQMVALCHKDWDVVHAVAVAAKHLDNRGVGSRKNSTKFDAGKDSFRPPAAAGVMVCGWSQLGDETGATVIPLPNDPFGADLTVCLSSVLKSYRSAFRALD